MAQTCSCLLWSMLCLAWLAIYAKAPAVPAGKTKQESLFSQQEKLAAEHRKWRLRKEAKQRVKEMNQPTSAAYQEHERIRALNEKAGREDHYKSTTLPPPYEMLSFFNYSQLLPLPTTVDEEKGTGRCSFWGAFCPMENVEHRLVRQYIRPNDVVLEVGARFGTTTCTIAAQQQNSGLLVAVEPDASVWHLLARNVNSHFCSGWILRGVVSNEGHVVSPQSYGTRAHKSRPEVAEAKSAFVTFEQLQEAISSRFTALLIDCEGCIDNLFAGSDNQTVPNTTVLGQMLRDVRTIILEADMGRNAPDCYADCVDYSAWINRFEGLGYRKVHQEVDPSYWFIAHYVFQRA